MPRITTSQTPALRRALAADYAIGLMPPTARKRFEHLLLDDGALRAELARWQNHLTLLTEPLVEQPVPEHVWQAVVARIEPQIYSAVKKTGQEVPGKSISGLCSCGEAEQERLGRLWSHGCVPLQASSRRPIKANIGPLIRR